MITVAAPFIVGGFVLWLFGKFLHKLAERMEKNQ